jgi:hypothetical protein
MRSAEPVWHDRCVPPTPPPGRRPPRDRDQRRAEREERRPPREPISLGAVSVDELDDLPKPVRVKRLLSLGIAGLALLLAAGLVVGAQTGKPSFAVVIFGVQFLFVGTWTVASRPPAPRVVFGVGVAVGIAANIAAVMVRPASLAPLAYVTAAGFIVGVIGQLSRPAGRIRVTESLGSSLIVSLGAVSFATLIVLSKQPAGTQSIVGCLAAAGVAVAFARLADIVLPVPRMSPQVPRGGFGVVLGAMAGTAAAGAVGGYLDGIDPQKTAIAGLVTAIVAVMVDLSIGYAEASRHIDGDAPALWIARHMQGPLTAFAFAAPAAYAASALLLLES